MRYGKKEVEFMFDRLQRLMPNKRLALDYNAIYGGYKIVQYLDNDGESYIFDTLRRTSKEMYLSMYMTIWVLEKLNAEATS